MHGMRRFAVVAIVALLLGATPPSASGQTNGAAVIFVHGMGQSAADVGVDPKAGGGAPFGDLLEAIADAHPDPDACQDDAQPDRPWTGSPCVFRYVEDLAEAAEGYRAQRGENDSQSAVQDNAEKLASEIEEVYDKTRRSVVLIGYSMGGAIIRTYLATHRQDADTRVAAVILVDAVTSGSWGYAFAEAVPRRAEGSLGERLRELMRSTAASSAKVDFTRPATRDLRPRSALFRRIAPMPLPKTVNYYTFWGDIRVSVERGLLVYDLPDFDMPALGDLGLLPGDPDPTALPELGGQRFSPPVNDDREALDVPHTTRISLDAVTIGELIDSCGHKSRDGGKACRALVAEHFDIPNTHTSIPTTLGKVEVEVPELGGRMTLLDAVLTAVERNS
jgi:pimeloyl-ACP methyl ester carboxylesterase